MRRIWAIRTIPRYSALAIIGDGAGYPVATEQGSRIPALSIDEQHVALPKLYGAPAYARPPGPVATVARPFDPDDLPIDAFMTDDERDFASTLPARAWAPGGAIVEGREGVPAHDGHAQPPAGLRPRALNLKSIAGKLLNGD
jgi:hypothetical protein